MKKIILVSFLLAVIQVSLFGQENRALKIGIIGFYNIENLFDTIDDPNINDEEFLPIGVNKWNTEKYTQKLQRLSDAIYSIGTDYSPDGAAVLGLSEIENSLVLEDLVATEKLAKRGYKIIHYDGPDRRGVDVALLYQPKYFTPTSTSSIRLHVPDNPDFRTRDQLLVSGMFDGEEMHFIVVHWPSRYGGEKRSLPFRIAAAELSRHITDSLLQINPKAKVMIMGDFNDTPANKSILDVLKAKGNAQKLKADELFNPMYDLHKKGIGSNAYRDSWSLIDQIIVTQALLPTDFSNYQLRLTKVHNKRELVQQSGRYKGYPFRTFSGSVWLDGYSDHFPVYIILAKDVAAN
ncbi:MAG: endonuclease/exonuclease/phosphatase family protein [Lentimicrobiaceae bacterium]|jgi:endonuclease/exonuclease/phosphatase family metal-dependent hydrolase|nr:endonuclease/exonuclease/phosphatase family protein [Lentimicrobiaceae bacterium]